MKTQYNSVCTIFFSKSMHFFLELINRQPVTTFSLFLCTTQSTKQKKENG